MAAKTSEKKRLKRQTEKYAKWKKYYFITLITGLILIILEINLYRKTIIPLWIPLTVIFTIGVISFFINRTHYNLTNNTKGWFFPLLQNIISWGFISCYLFIAMNYYFAEEKQHQSIFEIKSKSSMPGSRGHRNARKPLVTIDYFGFEKELVFTNKDTKKVDKATQVKLVTKKGLLGFVILEHFETVGDHNW
ncbi:MAG: hypothetical protein HYZ44_11305 [Bacteroidetes bacterium]|nr:hypothetical protein [Bacteroidota bacterium]